MLTAAAVVLVGFALAGCSKAMVGVLGLQRFDGHLYAHVEMCEGHTVDELTMWESGGVFRDKWTWPAAIASGTLDLGVYADAVTLLDTGNTFYANAASSSWSGDIANGPAFTSEDLAGLEEGEVLAYDAGGDWQLRAWTAESFEFMADRYCEPFER